MHLHLNFIGFAAATLLFSLSSYHPLTATPLNVSSNDAEIKANTSEIISERIEIQTLLNDPSNAIEVFEENLAIAQETGNRPLELKLLIAMGDAYDSLGNYKQAVESAKASLIVARELQDGRAQAISFLTLASAYRSLASDKSDYRKALRPAISALTTAWTIKDYDSEAKALAMLGSVYSLLDENDKALLFAKQALKVAKVKEIPDVAASSLLTLADVHLKEGDYRQVIEATEQSLHYLQNLQQPEAEGAAFLMGSLAYFGQGNSQESRRWAEQGLAISQENQMPLLEALAFSVLSLNDKDSDNFQKAAQSIDRSREIAKEQDNRELEALTLEVLGGIYRDSRQKEQAIAAYQESIAISDAFSAKAGLARVYLNFNLVGTAITYYKQAINQNEEEVLRRIPRLPVWLQASFPQAVQDLNGASTTEVYRSLANLLLSQKRPAEAQQVLELLKGQELREYTDNSITNGQSLGLTITPTEKQILKEHGSLIAFGQRLDECQQTRCPQLEQLLEQRVVLTEQYYQALEQLEALISNIRNSDEAFLEPNEFLLKAQEIVDAQPDTVLIYPLVLQDRIWLLWASKGGIFKSVEVPGVTQAQLGVWVMRFRQLLQNPLSSPNEVKAVGKQLYDWLIDPLQEELKANNIHHLVFSLDRSTRYIPMSALFDGEKYLIENYTVSTVLSANLASSPSNPNHSGVATSPREAREPLSAARNSVEVASLQTPTSFSELSQEPSVLALGVSESVAGFPPLPHVPAELNAIVQQDFMEARGVYPGQKFLDRSFDFFTLRDNLAGHQLLHIATHSQFIPGRAHKSFLLLGTGEKLAIPDIERLVNLPDIDLVVLSACETALGGPGHNGKEIAGIAYYFLKGGANTVLASLWYVDDESTRVLMEQFYQSLARETLNSPVMKAEALRQAQLAMLKGTDTAEAPVQENEPQARFASPSLSVEQQGNSLPSTAKKSPFSHPYYWSAFILMGSSQ